MRRLSHPVWSYFGAHLEVLVFCFFFFQAEDGIRDVAVTGVQTCALPISDSRFRVSRTGRRARRRHAVLSLGKRGARLRYAGAREHPRVGYAHPASYRGVADAGGKLTPSCGAERRRAFLCDRSRRAVRLGVISDTHGLLRPQVFDLFREVDHILHGGDVGKWDAMIDLQTIATATAVT